MKSPTYSIFINRDGKMEFIYSDELVGLLQEGNPSIKRVSNVEPTADGQWEARMCDGTVLGPYRLRQEALDEEVKYLKEKMLGK